MAFSHKKCIPEIWEGKKRKKRNEIQIISSSPFYFQGKKKCDCHFTVFDMITTFIYFFISHFCHHFISFFPPPYRYSIKSVYITRNQKREKENILIANTKNIKYVYKKQNI